MRKHDCDIALADMKEDEKKEERYTGDDVRVEHRNVVQEGDGLLALTSHIVDADGCNCADYCGNGGCNQGDDHCVFDGMHQRTRSLHVAGEQI